MGKTIHSLRSWGPRAGRTLPSSEEKESGVREWLDSDTAVTHTWASEAPRGMRPSCEAVSPQQAGRFHLGAGRDTDSAQKAFRTALPLPVITTFLRKACIPRL